MYLQRLYRKLKRLKLSTVICLTIIIQKYCTTIIQKISKCMTWLHNAKGICKATPQHDKNDEVSDWQFHQAICKLSMYIYIYIIVILIKLVLLHTCKKGIVYILSPCYVHWLSKDLKCHWLHLYIEKKHISRSVMFLYLLTSFTMTPVTLDTSIWIHLVMLFCGEYQEM